MANKAACAIFIAATGILLYFLFTYIPFGSRRWTRDDPIPHAILRQSVTNGQIVLINGTRLAPAGVRRHPDVTESDYDAFLHAATAQGFEIIRSVDDGHAFLLVEPKFWNWCGTGNWAGAYIRWPLSELVIIAGYAEVDPEALSTLTADETKRLADCSKWAIEYGHDEPWRYDQVSDMIRYNGEALYGPDLDHWFEILND